MNLPAKLCAKSYKLFTFSLSASANATYIVSSGVTRDNAAGLGSVTLDSCTLH